MMNDHHPIGCATDIDLYPIRPGRDRRFERRYRVFMRGCIFAPMPGAAVGDDQRPGSATTEKRIETGHGHILRFGPTPVKKMPNCRSAFRHRGNGDPDRLSFHLHDKTAGVAVMPL